MTQTLTIGYSPCPNDTFIFYALTHGKVRVPGVAFREQLEADEDERIYQSRLIGLERYLSYVALEIREHGWLGVAKAREQGKSPTAFYALNSMNGDGHEQISYTEADAMTARAAIQWAQSISDEETSDYLHNLHVLGQQHAIEPKHVNLAASMIVAHQRAQAREAERTSRAAVSQHFGTVGKRETFSLTVERIFEVDGNYGVTNIHTMRDEAGNVAVWFCSSAPLEVDRTYTLKCTVKSHGERDGVRQTVLTRCTEVS